MLGEMVGQLLLAGWMAGLALQLWRSRALPRWLAATGALTVPLWLLGQTELLQPVLPMLPRIDSFRSPSWGGKCGWRRLPSPCWFAPGGSAKAANRCRRCAWCTEAHRGALSQVLAVPSSRLLSRDASCPLLLSHRCCPAGAVRPLACSPLLQLSLEQCMNLNLRSSMPACLAACLTLAAPAVFAQTFDAVRLDGGPPGQGGGAVGVAVFTGSDRPPWWCRCWTTNGSTAGLPE
ncbi:MAG: DUF4386 family protein [Chitinophagaceae bacterium]|nr:DUF4386 family protein [Rubrivivax sp.]